jgi:hypothetical protein
VLVVRVPLPPQPCHPLRYGITDRDRTPQLTPSSKRASRLQRPPAILHQSNVQLILPPRLISAPGIFTAGSAAAPIDRPTKSPHARKSPRPDACSTAGAPAAWYAARVAWAPRPARPLLPWGAKYVFCRCFAVATTAAPLLCLALAPAPQASVRPAALRCSVICAAFSPLRRIRLRRVVAGAPRPPSGQGCLLKSH